MGNKRAEAAVAEQQMIFDSTWSAAEKFEEAFSVLDLEDWYNEARIIRGGFATSQLASDFFEEFVTFVLNDLPTRGTSKRRQMKINRIEEMLSPQRKMIGEVVETWKERARGLEVTLPMERTNSMIPLTADAEIRDLDIHLKTGKVTRADFDSKIEEVMERYEMTPSDLSVWKSSQEIDF